MKSTTVVNLFGGPNTHKSTVCAGLFYELKCDQESVEIVTEVVKEWAYRGQRPGPFDQVGIFGKQASRESQLFGKVNYIITDSPLLLSPFYETHIQGSSVIEPSVFKHLQRCKESGIQDINFVLRRGDAYDQQGRFESLAEAKMIDRKILDFLRKNDVEFIDVPSVNARQKVKFIHDYLRHKN